MAAWAGIWRALADWTSPRARARVVGLIIRRPHLLNATGQYCRLTIVCEVR